MRQWEYCFCVSHDANLNELGEQGWEAVGIESEVTSDNNGEVTTRTQVLMKREKLQFVDGVYLRNDI